MLLPVHSTFTTVVKEPDNQDDKEGDKPKGDKRRHEVHLRNLLALEAETLDFPATIAKRSVRTRLDFNERDVRKVYTGLVDVDFVLGDPPACHAEFLRDEHGRIRFLGRDKFDFVELEGSFVVLAVKGAIVTAHVKADRPLVTRLEPHENAIVVGEVSAHGLAIAEIDLDTHIRVGIPLAEFVLDNDRAIGTGHGYSRRTPIHRVGTSHHVRVFAKIDFEDVV